MARESYMKKIPAEWAENRKNGLCPVCGKPPIEFEKGRKIYCSQKCSDKYSQCFMSWQSLCEKIYDERGKKCQSCGVEEQEKKRLSEEQKKQRLKEWIQNNKERIEHGRAEKLVWIDSVFKRQYDEAMDDYKLAMDIMTWEEKELLEGEPYFKRISFEVDHIKALINGGSMWDKKNLRVLCNECHAKKTREDMKEHRLKKKSQGILNDFEVENEEKEHRLKKKSQGILNDFEVENEEERS